ncbi:Lrp/AsnC family transcriptional regulator [Sphingomonas sp. GlSt437]|uniref:Lrp/AsnC family transcriptional regulator n=1 Tax=Sphingomonas sp. GlSt437 TaxID=3389970 RepID=UPI003A848CE4
MQIDRIDASILRALAADARSPVSQVAAQAGLSQSACSRRLQALEAAGLIDGYSARLAHRRLGFHVTALVDITLGTQVEEDLERFERAVAAIDGVVECVLVSGAQDYRLKIICRDLDDYERMHREHLGRLPGVNTISSSFVLRQVATRGEADALLGGLAPARKGE